MTVSTRRFLEGPGSLGILDLVETGMNHALLPSGRTDQPLKVVSATGEKTMMSRNAKLGAIGLLAFVVFAGTAGESSAGIGSNFFGTITINDLTDTPTVPTAVAPSGFPLITIVPNSGELLHFTLPNDFLFPASTHYADLFEDTVGGILSDRLIVTVTAGLIDAQFASDPAFLAIPVGSGVIHDQDQLETGQSQLLIDLHLISECIAAINCDTALLIDHELQFLVASDPGSDGRDVPEPATLLLLGSGLVCFAAVAWRRQHRA